MKKTIKIYIVTILCAALAVPAYLVGAAAPQQLEEFERYSELPLEIGRNIIVRAAQPLINYLREQYPSTRYEGSIILEYTFAGHTKPVLSIQFSQDGTHIVTTSADHTAKIWNAQTGQLLFTLIGHTGPVNSAQFSQDKTRVVTASADHSAKIWNAQTGQLLFTLAGHTDSVNNAQFNSDETRVVTASADHSAKIWNAQTGQLLFTLIGHTGPVNRAEFTAQGSVRTYSADNSMKIWSPRGDLRQSAFVPHRLSFKPEEKWQQFSPDETRFATAVDGNTETNGNTVTIWIYGPTEQFINWIKKDATFNQISYLASALNVPGAVPHTFNADQIRFLFANGQNSGFRQTMNDEQFNFLTTVLNIQPPAGVTPDVLQTNLQHRKDVLEKLIYYLRDIKKQQTNLWSLSKAKEPFIEWLQKHATSHQLTYIANQLGVPGVPVRTFSDAEISLLWANPRRNTGFALEMSPDIYRFLTGELGIKNPTSQTSESEKEQSEEVD